MHNKNAMVAQVRPAFNTKQAAALINLFKMAPPQGGGATVSAIEAMKMGLIFVAENGAVVEDIPVNIYSPSLAAWGTDARLFNQTFYKSFADVRDADPMQLLFDQILHYFTTYGAEAMGVDLPTYVPATVLEVPDIVETKFRFVVITMAMDITCMERIDKYFSTLGAPPVAYREHINELLPCTTLATDDIRSFELQVQKHTMDGTVPQHPVNFLRYVVFRTTNQTLVIKNRFMRQMIKNAASSRDTTVFDMFQRANAADLASIFLRYKPIFLAFKAHAGMPPIINHLRRLADVYHKPLLANSLQNFTQIEDPQVQAQIIAKASNRDLVKLLNSINTRVVAGLNNKEPVPAVYSIRNGRTFVREGALVPSDRLEAVGRMVYKVLIDRLRPVVEGKHFYIPHYIEYAIPTSEKQFIGNIPWGTRINGVPGDALTAGIHWLNQPSKSGGEHRIDIDLHLNSATRHFGWCGDYRQSAEVIYTGDLTDAPHPHGAAEAYWFEQQDEAFMLSANRYSGPDDTEFKFFMTTVKPGKDHNRRGSRGQDGRYTFDPNAALFPAVPLKFTGEGSSINIGMFAKGSFWFHGGSITSGIVPQGNYQQFIDGTIAQLNGRMMLSYLLEAAGAVVMRNHPDTIEIHWETPEAKAAWLASIVSLAPEDLAVDTLVNVIDGDF